MIKIKNHTIGAGHPCFIIAEIGINHNGDKDLAFASIRAAKESGADAVKFQNYITEDFILDRSLTYEYISQGKTVEESQYDMFKRYELSFELLKELKQCCDNEGITFLSTPTSQKGIDQLVELDSPLLKNGSDLLVNTPVIEAMAKTQIPTILSTGMATLSEVATSVEAFENAGGKELILLHCISAYPTPFKDVHMKKMQTLSSTFGHLVGFSDHTQGYLAATIATALGACVIEKHFTVDRSLAGPDHRFSSDPQELKELVKAVRETELCLGSSKFELTESEAIGRRDYRLSCVYKTDLPCGHSITADDIAFTRPATGFAPILHTKFISLTLKDQVKAGQIIDIQDFINQ